MFVTYLTEYFGEKMPKFYVGSSSLENIESGYRGSVSGKRYSETWESELRENPHLFKTTILTTHDSRKEALEEELDFQIKNDVVKSESWINESFAQPNGFFGRDVSGELNPNFGNGQAIKKAHIEGKYDKMPEKNRKSANTQWSDPEQRQKKIEAMRGKKKTRKTLTEEEFSELQRQKAKKANESKRKNYTQLTYNGKTYYGFGELARETAINKYRAKKMVENGEIWQK